MSESETTDPNAESREAAERIMTLAGWRPIPGADRFTAGPFVGGVQPDCQATHVKDWTKIPPGHPQYSADTPDTPHEAAQWLADRFSAGSTAKRYRFRRKTGETAQPLGGGDDSGLERALADSDAPAGDGVSDDPRSADGRDAEGDDRSGDPIDADFTEAPEPDALDAELLPDRGIAWEAGDPGEDIAAAEDEARGAQFYMGDNLDRLRSQAIGDVVRISMAKEAAIWVEAGASETDYRDVLNRVMHDTVNGSYTGDGELFRRFNALQIWANAATAVRSAELAKTAFLTDESTTREQVERFNAKADWP